MPSTRRYLIAGLDPTGLSCVSKADLLQMHSAEAPDTDIGFCIASETTPDAGTYTELSRFLWIKRSTRELYVHDGVSFGLAHATINIPSASITADRLSPSGGSPYYALAVNSAGTEITLQSVPTLIPTNSLSVTQLTKAGVDSFLLTFAGVNTWKSLADAWDILFLNAIPAGSNRDFLYIDGGALAYGSINNVLPNNIIKWNKLEYGTNILTISSGAITIDASLSGNHKVMLTENITSITISNMIDGQTIQVLFKQDGTGSRTVAFGTTIKFVGGTAPTITATANHGDIISISQFGGQLIGAVAANASL